MKYSDELYRLAFEVLELSPWSELDDNQLFGFRSRKTGEEITCCVMGALGEYFSLSAYIGYDGLQSYYALAVENPAPFEGWGTPDPDELYALNGQNCVQCNFWEADELEESDLAEEQGEGLEDYMDRAERVPEDGEMVPVFLDFRPLFTANTLKDPERLAILEEAMQVCLMMGKVFFAQARPVPHVFFDIDDNEIPFFEWKDGKWTWQYKVIPSFDEDYGLESVPFQDNLMARRLGKLPRVDTVQMELLPLTGIFLTEGDEEGVCPEGLLTYYEEKAYLGKPIIGARSSTRSKMDVHKGLLKDLCDQFLNDMKALPKQILVRGEQTYSLLEDFCEKLNIPLELEFEMPELDEVYEDIVRGTPEDMMDELEASAQMILENLSGAPRGVLKTLPMPIKDFIMNVPEEALSPETYRAIRELAKKL